MHAPWDTFSALGSRCCTSSGLSRWPCWTEAEMSHVHCPLPVDHKWAQPQQTLAVPAGPSPAGHGQEWDNETLPPPARVGLLSLQSLSQLQGAHFQALWVVPPENTPTRLEVGEAPFTPCPRRCDGDSLCGGSSHQRICSRVSLPLTLWAVFDPWSCWVPKSPRVLGQVLRAISCGHPHMGSWGRVPAPQWWC